MNIKSNHLRWLYIVTLAALNGQVSTWNAAWYIHVCENLLYAGTGCIQLDNDHFKKEFYSVTYRFFMNF